MFRETGNLAAKERLHIPFSQNWIFYEKYGQILNQIIRRQTKMIHRQLFPFLTPLISLYGARCATRMYILHG